MYWAQQMRHGRHCHARVASVSASVLSIERGQRGGVGRAGACVCATRLASVSRRRLLWEACSAPPPARRCRAAGARRASRAVELEGRGLCGSSRLRAFAKPRKDSKTARIM